MAGVEFAPGEPPLLAALREHGEDHAYIQSVVAYTSFESQLAAIDHILEHPESLDHATTEIIDQALAILAGAIHRAATATNEVTRHTGLDHLRLAG